MAQAQAKTRGILSTNLYTALIIVKNLFTYSNNSKKYGEAVLNKKMQPSIESRYPHRKPNKFALYRITPVQKRERLKKTKLSNCWWWNPSNPSKESRIRQSYLSQKRRNFSILGIVSHTECRNYQGPVPFFTYAGMHWFRAGFRKWYPFWSRKAVASVLKCVNATVKIQKWPHVVTLTN